MMEFSVRYILLLLIFCSLLTGQDKSDGFSKSSPDTSIFYYADRIDYDSETDKISLTGNAKLKYKKMNFSAFVIILDRKNNTVTAKEKRDTVYMRDGSGIVDSVKITGRPQLTEGNETLTGNFMSYDLNSKEGKVSGARTVMESTRSEDDTFFQSEDIFKLDNNDIHGINAKISSCSLEEPHYHFRADSIIVTHDKWVFAKPITLYFDEVPVGWFPFILYKNNRKRQSGFILPSYYYSDSKGNSFKHLGFFWNMTDYTDYTVLMDYYDNYGYLLKQVFRYKKKYSLNGYLSAEFTNDHTSHDWRFKGVHDHRISPSMSLNATADYVTKRSLVRDLGYTSRDRMVNKLYSSGVFTKKWFNTGDNFSIMSSVTQYVDTAIVKYTFPNMSYRLSGRKPFSDSGLPEMIKDLQYSGSVSSNRNVNVYDDENIFDENSNSSVSLSENTRYGILKVGSSQNFKHKDHKSTYYLTNDTGDDVYEYYNKDSTKTDMGLNTTSYFQLSDRIFRYFNIKGSFNYKHDVAFKYLDDKNNIVEGIKHRNTYNISGNFDTKIYGIFQPEFYGLRKVRHTISPSFGFVYNPDFSEKKYGYYRSLPQISGPDTTYVEKDIFSPSLIGATPSSEALKLSYNFVNLLEAKIKTENSENSLRLFNVNFSGFYNFAADSNKLSVINSRFSSDLYNGSIIGRMVKLKAKLNANAIFTPYDGDGGSGDYINRDFSFWDKNPLRTERWNISYTLEFPYSFKEIIGRKKKVSILGSNDPDKDDGKNFTSIPFDINGRVFFSEKYDSNENYTKNFHMNVSAKLQPARNWTVEYSSTINFLMPKQVTSTQIKIRRDMHCWQGEFEWDLFNKGFKLLINTKSSIFSDLKFDKDTRQRKW